MDRYKRRFTEDLPNEVQSELGKILFGDLRGKKEPDTRKEKSMEQDILDWVSGSFMNYGDGQNLSKDFVTTLKKLEDLKKYEPDVLISNSPVSYRAIQYNFEDLNIKLKMEDFEEKNGIYYSKKKLNYIPNTFIQSWTPFLKTALLFIKDIYDTPTKERYNFVLECKFPEKDLLFNYKFLNIISKKLHMKNQDEILHIGNSTLKVTIIMDKKNFNLAFK